MKKHTFSKRIGYWFDRMMSKGTVAMCLLLLVATASIVCIIGILGFFVSGEGNVFTQLWSSLMYTLDAGNLSGVPTNDLLYLFLMFLATLCGLFLTSILIGIIATGVEDRLRDLRKGNSIVQEDDYTVVIGFDSNIFTIINELVLANENKKKACVVILGEQPKEEMEEAISTHIPHTKTTKIICRSSSLHETFSFERCSIETSKSVIINVNDDSETIKILLALSAYLKDKELKNSDLAYVTSIQDNQYIEAAEIAGKGRVKIVFAKDAIARIISNTCRQHGLSGVLTEIFNFDGDELYFENVPELDGKTFKEAVLSFSNAVALGIFSNGRVYLNPSMDTVIKTGDKIILLEEDDGAYEYSPGNGVKDSFICNGKSISAVASNHLLVLGSNDKLPIILAEYDKYVSQGTRVIIVDDDVDESKLGPYNNLNVEICPEQVTRDLLVKFVDQETENILLLNDDSSDPETSDSRTLVNLIFLRDIADKRGLSLSITTEMCNVENQRLATQARVDDFVIGSNFASLLMSQLSENPMLDSIFDELLDESGSELYMKPINNYVQIGVPIDFYTLTESAARKGEVLVGYRHMGSKKSDVIVNPRKNEEVVFGEDDLVVVVAED